jgi:hypothetical protein
VHWLANVILIVGAAWFLTFMALYAVDYGTRTGSEYKQLQKWFDRRNS